MEKITENDKSLNILKWVFIIVSIIHVIYATVTMRGMYEDGAFWMIDILNRLSNHNYTFSIDFGHPRFFIVALNQVPLLFFHWICCLNNKTALMMLYTFTQFSLPLLALWWNYKLTKRTGRIDLLFWSLFCYCAILITFSIFSVVETLLGVTLHFILWNYMAAKMDYTKKDILAVLFLLAAMFATYEYVIFLGPIFYAASILYSRQGKNLRRFNVKSLIGFGALGASIFNIIYMLNVPGESDEIYRFFKEATDYFSSVLTFNALFSIITVILLIFYFFKKNKITNFDIGVIVFIYFSALIRLLNTQICSVAPITEQHLRSIPCWALPLIFLSIFIYDLLNRKQNNIKLANLMCIVLICGITQTCWQMVNTYYWDKNIQYMKKELAKTDSLLYIPSEHEEISSFNNEQLKRYIWHGIYATTSILFSDTYKQKTLLLNYDDEYEEYNHNYRDMLFVYPNEPDKMMIPYGAELNIKNEFWDLTDCAEALDKYNKEHDIKTQM